MLRRDCWELWIRRRESAERFTSLINFRVKKRRRLEDALRILGRGSSRE